MTRKSRTGSKSLQRRAFGTAGRKAAPGRATPGWGRLIEFPQFRPGPMPSRPATAWTPRPGRVYGFPLRREPDGK
jgi:hypothetical protein